MDKKNIYEIITKLIINEKRPIPKGILMEKVKLSTNNNKKIIYDCIDELIYLGQLKVVPQNGYLVEGYINQPLLNVKLNGKIMLNNQLDGSFIHEEKKYFIHHSNLKNAIDGDIVEIILMNKYSYDGTQHAIVNKIIEREHQYGVGTFRICGSQSYVELDNKKNYLKVVLDDVTNLVNGHKILIHFKRYEKNIIYGSVSKIIGHINDVGNDILSLIYEYGINPKFSSEIIDFVNNFQLDSKLETKVVDLTHLKFITIDPKTSKDLDDSYYLKKDGDNYELYVSIADVSSYVPYNSILDKEAINRSTSIYLVDRVVPMLPHLLSNDKCSLNENGIKKTITCKMLIDPKGNFQKIEVFPSKIKSNKQFSYDEVNTFFEKQQLLINNDVISNMLSISFELHQILRSKKLREGYINLDIKEPQIILDQNGFPIEIKIKQSGIAQNMIEDFMVAANSAVTIFAQKNNIPFIYRIHDKPSMEKLEIFKIEAKKRNYIVPLEVFSNPTSINIANLFKLNKDKNTELLSKLILRCMSKACYSTQNIGHFGLSLRDYTHFTSPIRRYPDLIVHRLFWMFHFAKEHYTDEQKQLFKSSLNELCEIANEKEIKAISLEREVNLLKFCQFMSKKIGNVFDATIIGIKSFGIFVELKNTIEGLVLVKNIGSDYWIYDNKNYLLYGQRTKKEFNFGDQIKVRLVGVNLELKQINFEIVGYER